MENKSSIDLGILAPIILGVLSIAGILFIFVGRVVVSRPAGEPTSTETPFRYIFLGTEPGLSTLTPEPTETPVVIVPIDPADFPDTEEPPFLTSIPPDVILPTLPSARTSTPTPGATETLQAVLAKYDDTYFQILYDGNWTSQTGVSGAYQGTLHISYEIENYALFTFAAEQIIITYQAGPGLGNIQITLDGLDLPPVSQASTQTEIRSWVSSLLVKGTHEIVIEHLSGGSVNLDSISIPDLSTPTPIITP